MNIELERGRKVQFTVPDPGGWVEFKLKPFSVIKEFWLAGGVWQAAEVWDQCEKSWKVLCEKSKT